MEYDIGSVQPTQGGSYQGVDANIQSPGRSSSVDQFVQAVGVFSPAVRKYAVTTQADISEEQAQQVLKNIHEEEAKGQANAAELVKNGQLALGANPWAAKAARSMFMQGVAKRFGDEIAQEYESSPVRNLAPADVVQWSREQFARKAKEAGFSNPHDAEYLEAFLPTQEAQVRRLVGYHTQVAAQRTERDLKEGIQQSAADVAAMNMMLPDMAAKAVGEQTLQAALMTGMAPRDAYENVLDGLISRAMAEEDVGYLDVAELVPTMNDRGESVPMGTRVWAQEKLEAARARLMSAKAAKARSVEAQDKLVREQNKNAVLAEAGDMLFGGGKPLPNTAQDYEKLIQKANELSKAGALDPELLPKLRKMRDDEVDAQLKSAERGEATSPYGAQAHLEATMAIQAGQVKSLDQLLGLYAAPAMLPYRKAAYKEWSDWNAVQESDMEGNFKGMKIGLMQDSFISALSVDQKASIESQWNGQIAAFVKAKKAKGEALDPVEANEYASRLADSIIARYTRKTDREGKAYAPPKNYVESYGDTVRGALEKAKNEVEYNRQYNKEIDSKVPMYTKDLKELPKALSEQGISGHGQQAAEVYERQLGAIQALATISGSPEAVAASKALNLLVAEKLTFQRQLESAEQARNSMNAEVRKAYKPVEPLMVLPQGVDPLVTMKLLREGHAVMVKRDGEKPGYRAGIYVKNPDAAVSIMADYVSDLIGATRKPDPEPKKP